MSSDDTDDTEVSIPSLITTVSDSDVASLRDDVSNYEEVVVDDVHFLEHPVDTSASNNVEATNDADSETHDDTNVISGFIPGFNVNALNNPLQLRSPAIWNALINGDEDALGQLIDELSSDEQEGDAYPLITHSDGSPWRPTNRNLGVRDDFNFRKVTCLCILVPYSTSSAFIQSFFNHSHSFSNRTLQLKNSSQSSSTRPPFVGTHTDVS